MASREELRNTRIEKLKRLKNAGIDPYPEMADHDVTLKDATEDFEKLSEKKSLTLVGRVMSLRPQGGITFLNLTDGTGTFQALFKDGDTPEKAIKMFEDTVDIGDFISLTGSLFVTKRGEKTILVREWKMLTKSLLPLPEKWHGITDSEERYRFRYLDLLMNQDLREMFVRKARFWDTARAFMKARGFLEVETPTLEVTTGGAEARPFKTHHNDFDMDLYLRISVGELWQKRLMAAGFPKTFEIGRVYRNEGTSAEHLQEFTNLEFYWAYAYYRDGMELVKEMYRELAMSVYGKTKFAYKGHEFDLASDWTETDYKQEIERQTGIDIKTADDDDIRDKLEELKVSFDGKNRERLVDTLWKYCRKNITGPAFVINLPKLVSPLAKSEEKDPDTTHMFHPIIAGSEVGRGYSELNDPRDQRERFETQQKMLEKGDEEAMMSDFEFVEMLEHGMPPTCGYGFGERLFSILENKPVRETQLFPLLRPKKKE